MYTITLANITTAILKLDRYMLTATSRSYLDCFTLSVGNINRAITKSKLDTDTKLHLLDSLEYTINRHTKRLK